LHFTYSSSLHSSISYKIQFRFADYKINILAFGAWEFDITRIIHPTATIYEILAGWNTLVAERIPMDLLFLSLFLTDVSDLLASKVHLIGFKGNKEELKL
jgi:hypothetical protein